jgi:hypothetical protein
MKTLVFVHGMRQENRKPAELEAEWRAALEATWKRQGVTGPAFELRMPYYGDVLDRHTRGVAAGAPSVVARGDTPMPRLASELLEQIGDKAGLTPAEIAAETGQSVVDRGLANQQWTQGITRLLGRKVPWLGHIALPFVEQVDAYLTNIHARKAVDDEVGPELKGSPRVIVSHSLGTIVSYRLLTELGVECEVPLFVTVGSPLGIDLVREYLKPPRLNVPPGVRKWVNGADKRDYVALYPALDKDSFCEGIENLTDIANRQQDPRSILDYLTDPRIAERIAQALA